MTKNVDELIVVPATADTIRRAADLLRTGNLVAFPTETVYGLGANALDPAAVNRIFQAKGRPSNNPIIVHVADESLAIQVASNWPERAQRLADHFWPGPLTLVLPKHSQLPDAVTAGGPTVGVRVPNHPVALELLRVAGLPVAAPSANRSTEVSPTTAQHVWKSLGSRADMILDGGPCTGGIESTVLDLTKDPPRILRPGIVTAQQLEQIIGPVETSIRLSPEQPLPSPGLLERHYAPQTPLEITDDDGCERVRRLIAEGKHVGWLTWESASLVDGVRRVDMPKNAVDYAAQLYAVLHELDECGLDQLIVASPPRGLEWAAVRDRLQRAAQ